MDAGKEQADDSGEVSLADLCQTSCSVLMSAKKSTKYLLSPKSTGKKKYFDIFFNYSHSSLLFFPQLASQKSSLFFSRCPQKAVMKVKMENIA